VEQEIRERTKKKLAEHGVAATSQRLDIGEVLFAAPQHLSADQIIERLKANERNVSKATVYNTLNMFVQEGLLGTVHVDPERTFYDSATGNHHHFYNVETKELFDIPAELIALGHMPALPEGTKADGVDVVIRVRGAAMSA